MATIFQSSQRSPAASNEEFVPAARRAQRARADRQYPVARNHARHRGAAAPRRADFRQARGLQPRRLGQRSRRAPDDRVRAQAGRTASGQGDSRLDLGQHRDRAGDGRCGARLSGRDRDGLQRQPRAQEDNRGLRRQADLLRSAGGLRRRDHDVRATSSPPTPSAISNPTNTTTRPTRSPISIPPGPKSGIRRAAASPTSWPESAPAAP